MVAEPSKLRPLGNLEKYHAVRHQLRLYTSVGLTATYRLPPAATGRSLKDDVYRACAVAIQQHPNLSVDVVLEGTKEPYFVRLPEIDLRKCVEFERRRAESSSVKQAASGDAQVDEFLQKHHNTFFDSGAPLWKLCILEDGSSNSETFTASFIFHHGIGDGTSGKVFHTTFAQALDQILQEPAQADVSSIVTPPAASLPPVLEKEIELPLSLWFLAKQVYKSKFQSQAHDPSLWAGEPVIPNTIAKKTNIKHLVVPELTATKLRKTCSANGATITAFLQILLTRLIFKQVDSKFTQINFQGSMSARRWMSYPAVNESMGNWVVDYSEQYHRDALDAESFPWHHAQTARKSLADKVASKSKNSGVSLLKFVSNVAEDVFQSRVGRPRTDGVEISNLGAFKMKKSGGDRPEGVVSIGRMIFSQDSGVIGAAIAVSTISGGDGCLVLCFSWQDGVVEGSFVESLMASVEQEIVRLSASTCTSYMRMYSVQR